MFKWKVKKSEHGMSLENFIYKYLGEWSHGKVKAAIDGKKAFVNGRNIFISKWNVKAGDTITFVADAQPKAAAAAATSARYKFIEVLFEDKYIIAANKPPFVDHEQFALTVQHYLKRQNRGEALPYLGQMHRLDKETSGVMVFTKKKMANTLADQFRERSMQKQYLALVRGEINLEVGRIGKPLEKGIFEGGKKVRVNAASPTSKSANTEFRVMERYRGYSLLKVIIKTGRTHQIRVHMADMGHPIVGDKVYGDLPTDTNPLVKGMRRQALHAEQLAFYHPVTNKKMKVNAPIPEDMGKLIASLREAV